MNLGVVTITTEQEMDACETEHKYSPFTCAGSMQVLLGLPSQAGTMAGDESQDKAGLFGLQDQVVAIPCLSIFFLS